MKKDHSGHCCFLGIGNREEFNTLLLLVALLSKQVASLVCAVAVRQYGYTSKLTSGLRSDENFLHRT